MSSTDPENPAALFSRLNLALKCINAVDNAFVRAAVESLAKPTDRDQSFKGLYYRMGADVGTLLTLTTIEHAPAIAMLARAMFELAVDIRTIDTVERGVDRMITFVWLERLRTARNLIRFVRNGGAVDEDIAIYEEFVARAGPDLDRKREQLWPNSKRVDHWSAMNLRERVQKLKAPFDSMYEISYPRLSWFVHPGLAGVAFLDMNLVTLMCNAALHIAIESYIEVLLVTIGEFAIDEHVHNVSTVLQYAKIVPFMNTPAEVERFLQEIVS